MHVLPVDRSGGRGSRSGVVRSVRRVRRVGRKHMVKVEPVPGCSTAARAPPWLASTCLTIASPSPVPPVARERAGSTRKNRSNTRVLVLGGDPDAAVGDGDLDGVADAPARDRHRRLRRRVRDGVLQQVGQRGDQQRAVAVDREPDGAVDGDLDAGRLRGQPAAGERLVARARRRRRRRARAAVRRPCSRDSAISSVTSVPSRVDSLRISAGEAAHLDGVVGGVEHGLGQQPHRARRAS